MVNSVSIPAGSLSFLGTPRSLAPLREPECKGAVLGEDGLRAELQGLSLGPFESLSFSTRFSTVLFYHYPHKNLNRVEEP